MTVILQYISIGHKVTLNTAIEITRRCSIYRVPEPVRQADGLSRDYIKVLQNKKKRKLNSQRYSTPESLNSLNFKIEEPTSPRQSNPDRIGQDPERSFRNRIPTYQLISPKPSRREPPQSNTPNPLHRETTETRNLQTSSNPRHREPPQWNTPTPSHREPLHSNTPNPWHRESTETRNLQTSSNPRHSKTTETRNLQTSSTESTETRNLQTSSNSRHREPPQRNTPNPEQSQAKLKLENKESQIRQSYPGKPWEKPGDTLKLFSNSLNK